MKKTPLPELIERLGQSVVARGLDVSAPAIAKALRSGRVILITEHEDGTLSGEEIRPFPSQCSMPRPAV